MQQQAKTTNPQMYRMNGMNCCTTDRCKQGCLAASFPLLLLPLLRFALRTLCAVSCACALRQVASVAHGFQCGDKWRKFLCLRLQ